jgi:hypothetical protein
VASPYRDDLRQACVDLLQSSLEKLDRSRFVPFCGKRSRGYTWLINVSGWSSPAYFAKLPGLFIHRKALDSSSLLKADPEIIHAVNVSGRSAPSVAFAFFEGL